MNKNSSVVLFAAIVGIMMATLSTTITSMPIASAQGNGLGNPNDLSTGPPIPNCTAFFQGNFQGPPFDTRLGCR